MSSYFKINFAEPGKSLVGEPPKEIIQHVFRRNMGISLSFLIVFVTFMISGGVFYITALYLPMERELKENKQKLKKIEGEYNIKSGFRKDRMKKAKNALKVIDELKKAEKKKFNWSERLKVLDRTLVKDLWLSSLQIIDPSSQRNTNKQDNKPKKVKGRNRRGKKKEAKKEEKKEENKVVKNKNKKYKVVIRGATYANPARRPLQKISRFMTNLIDEPYWGDYFFLKDWTIDSTESVISFEVTLESKNL